MNDFEFACYGLAERIHLPVGMVRSMPFEEFMGWFSYFERLEKERNPSALDSPENMLSAFSVAM